MDIVSTLALALSLAAAVVSWGSYRRSFSASPAKVQIAQDQAPAETSSDGPNKTQTSLLIRHFVRAPYWDDGQKGSTLCTIALRRLCPDAVTLSPTTVADALTAAMGKALQGTMCSTTDALRMKESLTCLLGALTYWKAQFPDTWVPRAMYVYTHLRAFGPRLDKNTRVTIYTDGRVEFQNQGEEPWAYTALDEGSVVNKDAVRSLLHMALVLMREYEMEMVSPATSSTMAKVVTTTAIELMDAAT
jgi:hypothetical protein